MVRRAHGRCVRHAAEALAHGACLRPWLGPGGLKRPLLYPSSHRCHLLTAGLLHDCAAAAAREEDREQRVSGGGVPAFPATPRLLQLASMVNHAGPSSSSFGSFAAGPLGAKPAAARLGARRPTMPLLPGMGAPSSAVAAGPHVSSRSMSHFYTEGEIFGTTFMYTTNMMFWAGIVGAVAFRRNLIILLLSAETVMLACNMNFLFTAAYLNDITGAIMSITITTIAACETAIGLALCVAYFHMRRCVGGRAGGGLGCTSV